MTDHGDEAEAPAIAHRGMPLRARRRDDASAIHGTLAAFARIFASAPAAAGRAPETEPPAAPPEPEPKSEFEEIARADDAPSRARTGEEPMIADRAAQHEHIRRGGTDPDDSSAAPQASTDALPLRNHAPPRAARVEAREPPPSPVALERERPPEGPLERREPASEASSHEASRQPRAQSVADAPLAESAGAKRSPAAWPGVVERVAAGHATLRDSPRGQRIVERTIDEAPRAADPAPAVVVPVAVDARPPTVRPMGVPPNLAGHARALQYSGAELARLSRQAARPAITEHIEIGTVRVVLRSPDAPGLAPTGDGRGQSPEPTGEQRPARAEYHNAWSSYFKRID